MHGLANFKFLYSCYYSFCSLEYFSTLGKMRIHFSKDLSLSYYSQNKQLLLLHTQTHTHTHNQLIGVCDGTIVLFVRFEMIFRSCSVTIRITRRYSDCAKDWTTEESWFDSRQGQKFPSSVKRPDQLRVNSASYKVGIERSADSTLSSTEIKNECSYIFTHAMSLWNLQGQLYFHCILWKV
jgi:hypothetical protein